MSEFIPVAQQDLERAADQRWPDAFARAMATELLAARKALAGTDSAVTDLPEGMMVRESTAVPEGCFWVNPTWLRQMTGPEAAPVDLPEPPPASRRVELAAYASPGVRVWSGWQRGEACRAGMDLDVWDTTGQLLLFVAPEDTISIATSFWRGLLTPSLSILTPEEFTRRYAVSGPPHVVRTFNEVVESFQSPAPLPRMP